MDNKQKYLYRYDKLEDIPDKHYKAFNWRITDDDINNRMEKIEGYNFFVRMEEAAKKFSYKIDSKEIITWLDSLTILNQLIKNEKLDKKIKKDIVLFQEYLIPFSNNYRADYLLCLGNKILILEFSYNTSISKYDEKLIQALRYKEILQTIIPRDFIIGQFIFSYYPEYEKDITTPIKDNVDKNQKLLMVLIKYINKFFDLDSASKMLETLE